MQTNKKRHTRRDTGRSMLCRRGHNTIGLVQRRCTCMMQTSIYPACWLRQQQQQQQQQQQPLLPTACPFLSAFLPCLCSRSSSNFHFVQPPRERHQRKWRHQSELFRLVKPSSDAAAPRRAELFSSVTLPLATGAAVGSGAPSAFVMEDVDCALGGRYVNNACTHTAPPTTTNEHTTCRCAIKASY